MLRIAAVQGKFSGTYILRLIDCPLLSNLIFISTLHYMKICINMCSKLLDNCNST